MPAIGDFNSGGQADIGLRRHRWRLLLAARASALGADPLC